MRLFDLINKIVDTLFVFLFLISLNYVLGAIFTIFITVDSSSKITLN